MESSGGLNVFQGGQPVTEAAYAEYLERRSADGPRGVGPCQLHYPPYQDQADELGGCWRPDVNCRVGFGLLAADIAEHGHEAAFGRYNGGPSYLEYPDAVAYARRAMRLLSTWQAIVSEGSQI